MLDFVNVRVGSFYTAGEMSSYATYIDGQSGAGKITEFLRNTKIN